MPPFELLLFGLDFLNGDLNAGLYVFLLLFAGLLLGSGLGELLDDNEMLVGDEVLVDEVGEFGFVQ